MCRRRFLSKNTHKKQITTLSRGFLIGMPYRWLTSQSLSAKIMSSRSPQIQVVVMVISRSFLPFYSVIICRGSPDNKRKIDIMYKAFVNFYCTLHNTYGLFLCNTLALLCAV